MQQQSTTAAPRSAGAGAGAGAVGAASSPAEESPSVRAWDESVVPKVEAFAAHSQTVGGTVAEQVRPREASVRTRGTHTLSSSRNMLWPHSMLCEASFSALRKARNQADLRHPPRPSL